MELLEIMESIKERDAVRKGMQEKYDKFKRSSEWSAKRAEVINAFNGIDPVYFLLTGKKAKAEQVHHIIKVRDRYDLRLDDNNLIPLSAHEHRIIEQSYGSDRHEELVAMLRAIIHCREYIVALEEQPRDVIIKDLPALRAYVGSWADMSMLTWIPDGIQQIWEEPEDRAIQEHKGVEATAERYHRIRRGN